MSQHPASALSRLVVAVLAACAISAAHAAPVSAPADSLFSSAKQMSSSSYLAQVSLNTASLQTAKPGQVFQITLPGVGSFQVVHDGIMARADGKQWLGHLKNGVQYSVVLLQTEQGMTGDIRTPQGAFRLGFANGTQWVARQGVAGETGTLAGLPRLLQVREPAATTGTQGGKLSAAGSPGKSPAKVAYPVSFNTVAMADLKAGDEVALDVTGKGTYPVIYDATQANDSGSTTWVGHLKDYGDDFRVLITTGPEGSVGNILTPSGELELTTVAGNQWLIDRSASGWSLLHPKDDDGVPPGMGGHSGSPLAGVNTGGVAMGGTSAAATATTTGTTTPTATATAAGATTLDVLVLYTPGFVTKNGATWRTRIDQLVALANQAYVDSGVNIQLRTVSAQQITYSDQTLNTAALNLLTTSSGAFSTVAALRKQYGADLVTLIRPFYMTAQGQNCGVGYIGGYGGASISGYANYAYSVVSDGRDTAGTNYYCTDYTFAHELGHNMGSMHDRATVTAQGGGTGAYPYSFGYGVAGSFGTVMSYISPVTGKFSNPLISTCGGTKPCGVAASNTTASADNAQSLNNTRAAVAAFQPAVVSTSWQIAGVVSRSGTALAGVAFTASGTGASCTSSATNGTYACTVPNGWAGTVTPTLAGNTFTPISKTYAAVTANQINQNYAATLVPAPVTKLTISGTVSGKKVAGVAFTVTGTGATCTKSATNGTYSCSVPSGWAGNITPSVAGARFMPTTLAYKAVTANMTGQNYLSY